MKKSKKAVIRRLFIVSVTGLFVMCCATTGSTPTDSARANFTPSAEGDRSANYAAATSDSAFEAVKSAYFDLNVDITAGSKEAGYLNGREKIGSEVATALLPGRTRLIYNNYNCVILGQSDNSIQIKIRIINAFEDGTSAREVSHEVYATFWEKVNEALTQ
jgi:hypothetical protein